MKDDWDWELEPKFETSEKTDRIAGIVILSLSSAFILAVAYIMVAFSQEWWPF